MDEKRGKQNDDKSSFIKIKNCSRNATKQPNDNLKTMPC